MLEAVGGGERLAQVERQGLVLAGLVHDRRIDDLGAKHAVLLEHGVQPNIRLHTDDLIRVRVARQKHIVETAVCSEVQTVGADRPMDDLAIISLLLGEDVGVAVALVVDIEFCMILHGVPRWAVVGFYPSTAKGIRQVLHCVDRATALVLVFAVVGVDDCIIDIVEYHLSDRVSTAQGMGDHAVISEFQRQPTTPARLDDGILDSDATASPRGFVVDDPHHVVGHREMFHGAGKPKLTSANGDGSMCAVLVELHSHVVASRAAAECHAMVLSPTVERRYDLRRLDSLTAEYHSKNLPLVSLDLVMCP